MPGGLKTLHVEMGRNLYGGALQVLYLLKGLKERGHEAMLLCPGGSAIEKEARAAGVMVFPIPVAADLDPTIALRAYRVIKQVRPDIVHLHSRRGADVYGAIAARLARAPAVILSRRVDDRVRFNAVAWMKYDVLPHKIIAISDGIRRVLESQGIRNGKVELVHSGIVPSEFQVQRDRSWFESEFGIPLDARVIGTVAQLIERKGHRFLFEAVPGILKEFPSTRFLVLGEGMERTRLEQHCRDLGIAGSVIFAGFRPDIRKILPNLDLIVHPALREGLGVCLLQAGAVGLPIVAAAVGGIPEIVRDGTTGILIPPGDTDAVRQAVLKVMRDPELAGTLGEGARELVESEFSVDAMVEGNIRVYQETLGGGQGPGAGGQ